MVKPIRRIFQEQDTSCKWHEDETYCALTLEEYPACTMCHLEHADTVTIIGSVSACYNAMEQTKHRMEERGKTCYIPCENVELLPEVMGVQRNHMQRIDKADTVLVFNRHHYIGDNTFMEIGYAFANGIPLSFLSVPMDMDVIAMYWNMYLCDQYHLHHGKEKGGRS